jgi:hypothetical protein
VLSVPEAGKSKDMTPFEIAVMNLRMRFIRERKPKKVLACNEILRAFRVKA